MTSRFNDHHHPHGKSVKNGVIGDISDSFKESRHAVSSQPQYGKAIGNSQAYSLPMNSSVIPGGDQQWQQQQQHGGTLHLNGQQMSSSASSVGIMASNGGYHLQSSSMTIGGGGINDIGARMSQGESMLTDGFIGVGLHGTAGTQMMSTHSLSHSGLNNGNNNHSSRPVVQVNPPQQQSQPQLHFDGQQLPLPPNANSYNSTSNIYKTFTPHSMSYNPYVTSHPISAQSTQSSSPIVYGSGSQSQQQQQYMRQGSVQQQQQQQSLHDGQQSYYSNHASYVSSQQQYSSLRAQTGDAGSSNYGVSVASGLYRPRTSSSLQSQQQQQQSQPPQMVEGSEEYNAQMATVPEFIKKIYKMLESKVYQNIIDWTSTGESFIVKDPNELAKMVLPNVFKHSNFASFVRQLNKYDFHKVKNGEDLKLYNGMAWEFNHPNFKKGRIDILHKVRRKSQKKIGSGTSMGKDDQDGMDDNIVGSTVHIGNSNGNEMSRKSSEDFAEVEVPKSANPVSLESSDFQLKVDNLLECQQIVTSQLQSITNSYQLMQNEVGLLKKAISSQCLLMTQMAEVIISGAQQKQLTVSDKMLTSLINFLSSSSSNSSQFGVLPQENGGINQQGQQQQQQIQPGLMQPIPATANFGNDGVPVNLVANLVADAQIRLQMQQQQQSQQQKEQNGNSQQTSGHGASANAGKSGSYHNQHHHHQQQTSAQQKLSQSHKREHSWTSAPKVLLVEDDPTCRTLSSKLLQIFGCKFDVVTDGLAAVNKMNFDKYDLVLMDIMMPTLDGVSATHHIRQFDKLTPIISMTGNTTERDLKVYLNTGMTDILPKPFSKASLLDILERYCSHLVSAKFEENFKNNPMLFDQNSLFSSLRSNPNPFDSLTSLYLGNISIDGSILTLEDDEQNGVKSGDNKDRDRSLSELTSTSLSQLLSTVKGFNVLPSSGGATNPPSLTNTVTSQSEPKIIELKDDVLMDQQQTHDADLEADMGLDQLASNQKGNRSSGSHRSNSSGSQHSAKSSTGKRPIDDSGEVERSMGKRSSSAIQYSEEQAGLQNVKGQVQFTNGSSVANLKANSHKRKKTST
ncbi:hypothetical protein MP228_009021 [Amoeboaphelidium protococcarum]|nr:hypothetical protein MP228_009021 [Amoeboaphelidium protococcarum]